MRAKPALLILIPNSKTSKFEFMFEEFHTTKLPLAGYFFPMYTACAHPSTLSY